MSANEAWRALRTSWINVYAGAPEEIRHDAGTNFDSKYFENAAKDFDIKVKCVPTEAHYRIGKVERAHSVLRSVYQKLKIDLPEISKEDRLSLSFRALNDVPSTVTGVTPTMLVFGIRPKLPGRNRDNSLAKRAQVVEDCTKLAKKMISRRLIRDSTNKKEFNMMHVEKVRQLTKGDKIVVWREGEGWKIYSFVRVNGNEVRVQLPSGHVSSFPIEFCRAYKESERAPVTERNDEVVANRKFLEKSPEPSAKKLPWVSGIIPNSFISTDKIENKSYEYNRERAEEVRGLWELGCFEIVDDSEARGQRIYRSRFVDKTKSDGSKKSRLVIAATNDNQHGLFTAAPTIKRLSIRLLLSISASMKFKIYTRDVTKAFIMSRTGGLRREIFMKPPKEFELGKGKLLRVKRPLYGMPESPMHWFKTYSDHFQARLKMNPIPIDPCLLHAKDDSYNLRGILGCQVDDTLFGGNKEFLCSESIQALEFPSRGRTEITETPTQFNGVRLLRNNLSYEMDQITYISKLRHFKRREIPDFETFRSFRAKYAYAAYTCMPNILVWIAKLSHITKNMYEKDPTSTLKLWNSMQSALKKNPKLCGLKFVPIPPKTMEVLVCIDASFATNDDKTSQIGILALLRNSNTGTCNILHYQSHKSKRVCRSVLAAELFSMIEGYDLGYSIKDSLQRILSIVNIPLKLATDSHSLFSLAINLSQTTERRLLIDLASIREGYEKRWISDIIWIPGTLNPADDLTKPYKQNGSLQLIMETNNFNPFRKSWVSRDSEQVKTV